MDEFAAIDRFRALFEAAAATGSGWTTGGVPPGEVWIGDDAAVISGRDGERLLFTADLVVEGVHFDLGFGDLADAGWKALAVAASDIAAMGAAPRFALLSLAAPSGTDVDRFAAGVAEASSELDCPVIGGDLSAGPAVVASVTVGGGLAEQEQPLLRSGARAGDVLFVTGPLGASAAGLRLLRAEGQPASAASRAITGGPADALAAAYRRPRARVGEGMAARRGGASAAIDVSDGLASDVRQLAAASRVGIVIDDVPVADGATWEEAVGGGEDYALILAAPEPARLRTEFAASGLAEPLVIGRCTDQPGRFFLRDQPLPIAGWHHRF
jgi:thiamine-monophosphate kinase